MVDTVTIPLGISFTKIFDATTDAGKSFTIQNISLIPIRFLKKSTAPLDTEKGLVLGADQVGAVLDISDDVYFRATNSRGANLVTDQRT